MWSSVATFTEFSQSSNLILEYDFNRRDVVALYTGYVSNASTTGHTAYWTIAFNTHEGISYDAVTVAHELGHVIGLTDLYDNQNINKLMYYSNASTATSPTTSDLWGAKVILGIHTSHAFTSYRYWGTQSNSNYHVAYCTDCNGNSATHSACIYKGGSTRCFACNVPKNFVPTA